MKIYRHIRKLPPCVITMGHFDGLHLGHHALVGKLLSLKQETGLPARVLTFQKDPLALWGKAPAQLMTNAQKLRKLQAWGVDELLCVPFDQSFSQMSAAFFMNQLLEETLQAQGIVLGTDFRFGHLRQGRVEDLQRWGQSKGLRVEVVPDILDSVQQLRISSTRLRAALEEFDPALISSLLGASYRWVGRVVHGAKRGREWGVPTLNFVFPVPSPLKGVFAVRVHGLEGAVYGGVANVGRRPTLGGNEVRLEVHVFGFDAQVYGARVEVEFLFKLRDEKRFDSLDALKIQIFKDMTEAKERLKNLCPKN